MKLKVRLLHKCPNCGKTLRVVKALLPTGLYIFRYCLDYRCRYAEDNATD